MALRNSLLAVIPARGGSKGIPRKNVRDFLGKPLLAWTIETAAKSGVFNRIVLSTEDEEIARIGREYGAEVPFLRPSELAQDTTPTAPVVRHAMEWFRDHEGWVPDFVAVLEPTSPLRRPFHVKEAAEILVSRDADSVASISEVPHHYSPCKALVLGSDNTLAGVGGTHVRDMVHRRQDLPVHYTFNGLWFSCRADLLWRDPPTLWGNRIVGYLVEPKYSVDLDRPEDWVAAEARMHAILDEEVNSEG